MQPQYSPKSNPRVIIIQKLYGKFFNKEEELTFPKHRFKKFIKDIVKGTIERNEVIDNEIQIHLENDIKLKKLDKIFIIVFIRDSNLKSVSSTLRDFKSNRKNKIGTDKSIRNYGIGAQIIKALRVKNMILVTRSPKKVIGLEGFGIRITKQEIIK